ncbi:hypothetical protein GCM10017710_40500 [Arthrobacter ramosus]
MMTMTCWIFEIPVPTAEAPAPAPASPAAPAATNDRDQEAPKKTAAPTSAMTATIDKAARAGRRIAQSRIRPLRRLSGRSAPDSADGLLNLMLHLADSDTGRVLLG